MLALVFALQTVAVQNVHVIPMDREHVLRDHVVLVQDGRITAVGRRGSVPIPSGARRIDGRGGYLVPGLADLHVHVRLRTDLVAYLAYGVTTVADMGGPDRVRAWRDSIRAGSAPGPQVFVGYFVDGAGRRGGVNDVAGARAAVVQASALGFDFIKVYNALTAEQFAAIMSEAKQRGLAVTGHGVRSVGLERGFASGQSLVVHAEEYLYTELKRSVDTTNIARVVAMTKQHGAYVLPNLSAFDAITRQWGNPQALEVFLRRPEASSLPSYWVRDWRASDYVRRSGSLERQNAFLKKLTVALQRAGVPLLSGTDSPVIPGMLPGASLHDELGLLVEAGLTPFEAMVTATRNAGEFAASHLRSNVPFGLVARGHRADLVLLPDNPLEEINTLRAPIGVMAGGQWLDQTRLQELLKTWSASTN